MLYELLTGQYPFEPNYDPDPEAVERDRANRFGPFPPVRAVNPRVPHAVASIIGKCLAPDVAGRYQSAAQLLEDLDRQVARRPLRFAPNVSRRERVGKWAARNRVAVAAGVVLAIGGTAAGGVAYRDARNQDEIRRLAVLAAAEAFAADRDEAEFCFYPADRDPEYKRRAWAAARSALGRIGAWDSDGWADAPALRGVPADLVRDRRREAADLMVLLSHSRAADAARTAAGPDRDALLRDAQAWNRRAEQAHPTPAAARAIWCQRGFLARLAGDAAEEERHRRAAGGLARGPAEAVLEGRQLYAEGRTHAALAVLADALRVDPRNFWAAFYAGACHMANGESAAALSAFNVCNAIRPGFFGTLYNRAQARFRQGDLKAAEDDLDAALEARPDWAEAHFERAMVREVAKRYPDAIADATRALELGYPPTAVFLFRSRVYGRMGEKALADRDLAEGLKAEPTDERGWLARAQAQLYRDPARALADFAEALKLNPRQVNALQGTAHLLSRAGKNAEAADILTTLIGINPESPDAWSGRGVLRARLGDRAGALADAREALRLSDLPKTKYQVAGIHALFAKTHPDDRAEALSLLDGALRAGFGFDLLDKDKELDPLRADPDFTRTVTAARASWKARQRVD
jgi:tetratricopeptide (TPR) repeat protein